MKTGKIIGISFASLIVILALSFGFGYFDVFHTKTVGKAKQNAQREIFEETQSYVEGKRQEAIKDYKEWLQAEDVSTKKALENMAAHKYANFDTDKLDNGPVKTWVYNCKNGISNIPKTTTPFNND